MSINREAMKATADKNVFHVGTTAYYDTFSGMIPCIVTAISPGRWYGFAVGGETSITIRLTKTVGAYKKGEIIQAKSGCVVPRKFRVLRGHQYRINTSYCFYCFERKENRFVL